MPSSAPGMDDITQILSSVTNIRFIQTFSILNIPENREIKHLEPLNSQFKSSELGLAFLLLITAPQSII